ncbi:ABC transporter ATP-binding protein [Alicyclobacillus macrosporangiidus]|uniref:ABC transporter ATP-binding protein n=1 Tax=Alicyclobacillus macrosporangiidus TaxID=392015 RepID=UPI000AD73703|nr:ABC transporter ATP-binding protein [Alicyclobacillus macrosporangiidus]
MSKHNEPPLLVFDHVKKHFGGLFVTNDVSFSVQHGEVLFIIGPNGAGKTTIFNLITGFVTPDEGDIRFEGESIKGLKPYQIARRGIGRTFQIVKPLANMSVLDNVMLGAFAHTSSKHEARREAEEILALTGLDKWRDMMAGSLPLAGRKRLEIARALATRPKLILLDEVCAGLTPTEAVETIQLLKQLRDRGVSAIGGIEHVMRVVMEISDRVIVIHHGQEIAEGTPQEVTSHPDVIEAYLGAKLEV